MGFGSIKGHRWNTALLAIIAIQILHYTYFHHQHGQNYGVLLFALDDSAHNHVGAAATIGNGR